MEKDGPWSTCGARRARDVPRVELGDTAVWRRLEPSSDLRLDELHPLLQVAWTTHAAVRLDDVVHDPGDELLYEYDFGDGWVHTTRLEEVLTGTRTRLGPAA